MITRQDAIVPNGSTTISEWAPLGRFRLGWLHDMIRRDGAPYLERWQIYVLGFSLRLHKFWSADEDDPHDHPFWFWTIPLRGYEEVVLEGWRADTTRGFLSSPLNRFTSDLRAERRTRDERIRKPWTAVLVTRPVRALRPHFRPAWYAHVVQDPDRPIYTVVLTGRRRRKWGFWVDDCTRWVPYEERGVEYDRPDGSD